MRVRAAAFTTAVLTAATAFTVPAVAGANATPSVEPTGSYRSTETLHLVTGRTFGTFGKPVDNVSFTAVDAVTGRVVASSVSYGGEFELRVPAGTYTIRWTDLSERFVDGTRTKPVTVSGDVALGKVQLVAPAPTQLSAAKVTGIAQPGSVLTAAAGSYALDPAAVTVTWVRAGKVVGNAATYKVAAADVGTVVTAKVTASWGPLYLSHTAAAGPVKVTKVETATVAILPKAKVRTYARAKLTVAVKDASTLVPTGRVVVLVDGRQAAATLERGDAGRVTLTLPRMRPGKHKVAADYHGSAVMAGSKARIVTLIVTR